MKILLVEDNPGDIRLTQEALRRGRDQVDLSVVEDGQEALAFLRREGRFIREERPALILLDLNLPKRDGRLLLAEIKSDPTLKDIPVVIFTSSEAYHDIRNAYDLYANCYIVKPVELEQFLQVVQTTVHFWSTIASLP
jgi:CheY-like chemotaxis protein